MAKDKTATAARVSQSPAPEGAGAVLQAGGEPVVTHLQVRALVAGFRRAGRAWPAEDVVVSVDEFTSAQIEQLLGESQLVVLPIAGETVK